MTQHPPRVLGLYSPAPQSGKSTIASYLRGYGYERIAFATPIKDMIAQLLHDLGYSVDQARYFVTVDKTAFIPEVKTTVRHMLQTCGTEFGRDCIHPEIWLKCWETRASRVLSSGGRVVVEDVRFPNEAALIRKLAGQVWYVQRSAALRGESHASEGALDEYPHFDLRLTNNGSLIDLFQEVKTKLGLTGAQLPEIVHA